MSEPRRFFFVHLQKTGGTALVMRLQQTYGRSAVYPDDSDGDRIDRVSSISNLLARWPHRRDGIRFLTGHFPLCTAELLDAEFTTFTILREPVARTLSYLRHQRRLHERLRDLPLEAAYHHSFRFEALVHNHMVKMFALRPDTLGDGLFTTVEFTEEHLEMAKEGLAHVDVVGLHDEYDSFCDRLTSQFDVDLGPPRLANRTDPSLSADVSDSLLERIVADNELDIRFYDHARSLVSRPAPAAPPSAP